MDQNLTSYLNELLRLVKQYDLAELRIESPEFKIELRAQTTAAIQPVVVSQPVVAPTVVQIPTAPPPPPVLANPPAATSAHLYELRSPLVGVFYSTPSPDSPPYVTPGDIVKPGQTVCMIEAMKVFNEIHAEKTGRVVEVCATSGEVVEADQVLMRLDLQSA